MLYITFMLLITQPWKNHAFSSKQITHVHTTTSSSHSLILSSLSPSRPPGFPNDAELSSFFSLAPKSCEKKEKRKREGREETLGHSKKKKKNIIKTKKKKTKKINKI